VSPGEGATVVIHPDWTWTALHLVRRYGTERGGVLLGRHAPGEVHVLGAVFPHQRRSTASACAFGVDALEIVTDVLGSVRGRLRDHPLAVVGWIHSHPRIGVFVSEQDRRTLRGWTDLDRSALAMVVDPYTRPHVGVWGRAGVPRALRWAGAADGVLSLRDALPLVRTLRRTRTTGRGALWDLVCADGVVSVAPPLGRDDAGDPADEPATEPLTVAVPDGSGATR
jgi:hypothetical protein